MAAPHMVTYRLAGATLGLPAGSSQHGSLGWSSAALLVGDDRVVVVDTGGPGYRERWDGWLAAAGLSRHDVSAVLLTHCHWDHIGAAAWFPEADLYAGRTEVAWACAHAGADPFLEPGLLHTLVGSTRLDLVDDGDVVAGVRVMATPGHTPGHLSYLVPTTDGPLVVVGDAVKNSRELAGGPFATTVDPAGSADSRRRLCSLATDHGYRLLLGHDGIYGAEGPLVVPSGAVDLHGPAPLTVGTSA